MDKKPDLKHTLSKRDKRKQLKLNRRLNEYGISEDYPEDENFRLRIINIVLKKKLTRILVMTVVFALCISIAGYFLNLNESNAIMMLNYEQSIDGLTPNSTRFNISDFTTREVIERVIESAGLEEVITAEELQECISVTPTVNKKPDDGDYYIPTSYKVVLTKPWSIRDISSADLLEVICNTYSRFFYDQYTMNTQILSADYNSLVGLEYSQIASFLDVRINALSSYLDMRVSQSGEFRSSETGETFHSIKKMVDNLDDYHLSNYKAYIWENGIVRKPGLYVNNLSYLIRTNGRDQRSAMNEYYIRRNGIDFYSDRMAASILIPTISHEDFYMARTKIGVDTLAIVADVYLTTAKDLDKSISMNSNKLAKLKDEYIPEHYKNADDMIVSMTEELMRIEELSIKIDKEYQNERSRNYITFNISRKGFLSRIPKKLVLVCTFLFFLAVFYVYYRDCYYVAKRGVKK